MNGHMAYGFEEPDRGPAVLVVSTEALWPSWVATWRPWRTRSGEPSKGLAETGPSGVEVFDLDLSFLLLVAMASNPIAMAST